MVLKASCVTSARKPHLEHLGVTQSCVEHWQTWQVPHQLAEPPPQIPGGQLQMLGPGLGCTGLKTSLALLQSPQHTCLANGTLFHSVTFESASRWAVAAGRRSECTTCVVSPTRYIIQAHHTAHHTGNMCHVTNHSDTLYKHIMQADVLI